MKAGSRSKAERLNPHFAGSVKARGTLKASRWKPSSLCRENTSRAERCTCPSSRGMQMTCRDTAVECWWYEYEMPICRALAPVPSFCIMRRAGWCRVYCFGLISSFCSPGLSWMEKNNNRKKIWFLLTCYAWSGTQVKLTNKETDRRV